MITINVEKTKQYLHELRRKARSKEFEPLDNIIMKQIPGADLDYVEKERQKIRDKYTTLQNRINEKTDLEELNQILKDLYNKVQI